MSAASVVPVAARRVSSFGSVRVSTDVVGHFEGALESVRYRAFVLSGCPRTESLKSEVIMLTNIQTKIDGNKLTLTVDLSKDQGRSKSGKTLIVATSHGAEKINGVMVNLNVYKS